MYVHGCCVGNSHDHLPVGGTTRLWRAGHMSGIHQPAPPNHFFLDHPLSLLFPHTLLLFTRDSQKGEEEIQRTIVWRHYHILHLGECDGAVVDETRLSAEAGANPAGVRQP